MSGETLDFNRLRELSDGLAAILGDIPNAKLEPWRSVLMRYIQEIAEFGNKLTETDQQPKGDRHDSSSFLSADLRRDARRYRSLRVAAGTGIPVDDQGAESDKALADLSALLHFHQALDDDSERHR